jgi:hypothetical protein
MKLERLDITLRNGQLINNHLAGWLIEAANKPEGVKGISFDVHNQNMALCRDWGCHGLLSLDLGLVGSAAAKA